MLIFVMVCVVFLQTFEAQTFTVLIFIKIQEAKTNTGLDLLSNQINFALSSRVICIQPWYTTGLYFASFGYQDFYSSVFNNNCFLSAFNSQFSL